MKIVDLFAGPGGWSEALRMLGHAEAGIEWDDAACATARAAGHERLQADVAALDPLEFAPCSGLIASPPCQAWSAAGNGGGRRDIEHVIACAMELAAWNDTRAEHREKCEDPRSMLVVEPLRWALQLEPEWIAFEQVPEVIEFWSLIAAVLGQRGYKTWTGVLCAADYGVPQTRRRAILLASRTRQPSAPPQTHSDQSRSACLFGLKPWISMGPALGWDDEVFVKRERSGDRAEEGFDPANVPAQTLTSKARSWTLTRPAPTLVGTRRSSEGMIVGRQLPAGEDRPVGGWSDVDGAPQNSGEGVRVTVQEGGVIQSFRPDYPWQGSRSKQFEQVANAVPPLLARAVLAELVDPAISNEFDTAA